MWGGEGGRVHDGVKGGGGGGGACGCVMEGDGVP